MAFDRVILANELPEYLKWEAGSRRIVIGPRQLVQVADSSPTSAAAGATVRMTASFGSLVSNPVFALPSTPIILSQDQGLMIDGISFTIEESDAAGKLQIRNLYASDNFVLPLPMIPVGAPLPYTFGAVSNDAIGLGWGLGNVNYFVRNRQQDAAMAFEYFVAVQGLLVNLDLGAPHTYGRALQMTYRVVSGLPPLQAHTIEREELG